MSDLCQGQEEIVRLVRASRAGDKAAFDRLVLRHQRQAVGLALGILGNRDDAAEVVQEAFLKAHLGLGGLGLWVGDAHADKAQLEEKLKQELRIQLEDVAMAQTLEQIGQKAGVKIELSPQAAWKLPEGEQTRLSMMLEGRLSESLEKMLNSFFLRYAVGSESLTIYPRPELKRIIGRPTADELKLLTDIYTNEMRLSISTSDSEALQRFAQRIFGEAAIMPPDEVRTIAAVLQKMANKTSSSSAGRHDPNAPPGAPMTIALLLEGVEQFYHGGKTWYLQGPEFPRQVPEIRIVSQNEFGQARIGQIVDVSFENGKGETIVRQLATWADFELATSHPLPEGLSRVVTLQVQNVKLYEALDRVLDILGIEWRYSTSSGVISLEGPASPSQPSTPPANTEASVGRASAGDYVGKISIPMDGGKYFIEFMLRESDLTEELRQLRQQKVREIIEQLSKAAREQTQ